MRHILRAGPLAVAAMLAVAGGALAEGTFTIGGEGVSGTTKILQASEDYLVQVCNTGQIAAKLSGLRQGPEGTCPKPADSVIISVPVGNCAMVQACELFVDYQNDGDAGKRVTGTFTLLRKAASMAE